MKNKFTTLIFLLFLSITLVSAEWYNPLSWFGSQGDEIKDNNKISPLNIISSEKWIITEQSGEELKYNIKFTDEYNKLAPICLETKPEYLLTVDKIDKNIYDKEGKATKIKYSETSCKGYLIEPKTEFIKIGEKSATIVYQNISKVEYTDGLIKINSTIQKCNESFCGIDYPNVTIVDANKLKFGAVDYVSKVDTKYKYIFEANSQINKDSEGYYFLSEGKRIGINLRDICTPKYSILNQEEAIISFNPNCSYLENGNSLEVSFIAQYDLLNNQIFIDPSYTITNFTSAWAYGLNVTVENMFSHMTILNTVEPFNSLLAYFPFDSNTSTATAYDWSRYNRDGTFINRTKYTTSGKYYGGVDCGVLDSEGSISLPVSSELNTTTGSNWTVAFWINYRNDSDGGLTDMIFAQYLTSVAPKGGYRLTKTGTTITLITYNDTGGGRQSTITGLSPNTWYHVVVTVNDSNQTIYKDGVVFDVDPIITGGISYTTQPFTLCGGNAGVGTLNGTLDEFMIFNTSLNSTQVSSLYANTTQKFYSQGTERFPAKKSIVGVDRANLTVGNLIIPTGTSITAKIGQINQTLPTGGGIIYSYYPIEWGSVADVESYGLSGSTKAGANLLYNDTGGKTGGGAFKLNGSSYLQLGNDSDYRSAFCRNGCSMSSWLYVPDSLRSGTVIGRYDATASANFFKVSIGSTGYLQFSMSENGTTASICTTPGSLVDYPLNQWFMVTAVFNLGSDPTPAHLSVYINSTLYGEIDCEWFTINETMWDATESTFVGANDDGTASNLLNATVDNIAMFNGVLTPEEITQMFTDQNANKHAVYYSSDALPVNSTTHSVHTLSPNATFFFPEFYLNNSGNNLSSIIIFDNNQINLSTYNYTAPAGGDYVSVDYWINFTNYKVYVNNQTGYVNIYDNTSNFLFRLGGAEQTCVDCIDKTLKYDNSTIFSSISTNNQTLNFTTSNGYLNLIQMFNFSENNFDYDFHYNFTQQMNMKDSLFLIEPNISYSEGWDGEINNGTITITNSTVALANFTFSQTTNSNYTRNGNSSLNLTFYDAVAGDSFVWRSKNFPALNNASIMTLWVYPSEGTTRLMLAVGSPGSDSNQKILTFDYLKPLTWNKIEYNFNKSGSATGSFSSNNITSFKFIAYGVYSSGTFGQWFIDDVRFYDNNFQSIKLYDSVNSNFTEMPSLANSTKSTFYSPRIIKINFTNSASNITITQKYSPYGTIEEISAGTNPILSSSPQVNSYTLPHIYTFSLYNHRFMTTLLDNGTAQSNNVLQYDLTQQNYTYGGKMNFNFQSPSTLVYLSKFPRNYKAGYTFTDDTDASNLNTTLGVYFGTNNISSANFSTKGFYGHNIKALVTVFNNGTSANSFTDGSLPWLINLSNSGFEIGIHNFDNVDDGINRTFIPALLTNFTSVFPLYTAVDHANLLINFASWGRIESNQTRYWVDLYENVSTSKYVWLGGLLNGDRNAFSTSWELPHSDGRVDYTPNNKKLYAYGRDSSTYGWNSSGLGWGINWNSSKVDDLILQEGLANIYIHTRGTTNGMSNLTNGEWQIIPEADTLLNYLESKMESNDLYVQTPHTMFDYMIAKENIELIQNSNQVSITNYNTQNFTGLTLQVDNTNISSAKIGNDYQIFAKNNKVNIRSLNTSENILVDVVTGNSYNSSIPQIIYLSPYVEVIRATSPVSELNKATIILNGTGNKNILVNMSNVTGVYEIEYDGISCLTNPNCTINLNSNGIINLTFNLGSEHTIEIFSGDSVNCSTLTADATYTLSGNLTSNTTCITIGGDNIILDLNGYWILGNRTGSISGIDISNRKNITIKNGHIKYFTNNIKMNGVNNSIINNVTFHRAISYEVLIQGYLTENNLSNNVFDDTNVTYGIYAQPSFLSINNKIFNNSFKGSYSDAYNIRLRNGTYWEIYNNNFTFPSQNSYAIYVDGNISQLKIYNNLFRGKNLAFITTIDGNDHPSEVSVYDNSLDCFGSSHGILFHVENSSAYRNIINNCTFGMLLHNGTINTIVSNTTVSNSGNGLYILDNAKNNTVENMLLDNNDVSISFFRYSDRGNLVPSGNHLKNITVTNPRGFNIQCTNSTNNILQDIYLAESPTLNVLFNTTCTDFQLINVSYNGKESVDDTSNFKRLWYLDSTSDIVGTNLTLSNSSGTLYSVLSPNWVTQNLTQYIHNGTINYFGLYNLTASKVDYTTNITQINLTTNMNVSFSLELTGDIISPVFNILPSNEAITYGANWTGVDFNATDETAFENYSINDTRFIINSTGFLDDKYILSAGSYAINVSINDTSGNQNSTLYLLTINKDSTNCQVLFNETSPIYEGNVFRVWSDCTSTFVLTREGTIIANNSVQNLAIGIYNFSVTRNDNQNYTNYYDDENFEIEAILDITIPVFTDLRDLTGYTNEAFSKDFDATDNVAVSCFSLNDTSVFTINCAGTITNAVTLNNETTYIYNMTVNDTSGNEAYGIFKITISNRTTTTTTTTTGSNPFGFYNTEFSLVGKQNTCITIPQECADCSYVKVTTIMLPDLSSVIVQEEMNKNGTSFSYEFCNTSKLGTYIYCTVGDSQETDTTACNNFEITPTGESLNGWKISLKIFISLSTLFIMLVFLYLSNSGIKSKMATMEQGASKFFFMGLTLIFLIAHIIITSVIVHNTFGSDNSMSSVYNAVMYVFFTIIILIFLYTLIKIMIWEIDIFLKSKGRR